MRKVLVADDDQEIQQLLSWILGYDYEVHTVDTSEDAIEWLANHDGETAVVFMEISIPGDSLEALQVMRDPDNWPYLPLIIMGNDEPTNFLASLECGATEYLAKPFEVGQVLSLVGKLVSDRPFVGP